MKLTLIVIFIMSALFACSSKTSTNPNDYVGEYVFRPFNSDTDRFAHFLILTKDFKAVEIRFSKRSDEVSTQEKRWYLSSPPGRHAEIVIGEFAHPIEISGQTIKLENNYDLGMYYEKIR